MSRRGRRGARAQFGARSRPPLTPSVDRYFTRSSSKTGQSKESELNVTTVTTTSASYQEPEILSDNMAEHEKVGAEIVSEQIFTKETDNPEPSRTDLKELIEKLHNELCTKLENVKTGLEKKINDKISEVKEDIVKMDKTIKEHSASLTFVTNKVDDLEKKFPETEKKFNDRIEALESALMYQEMRSRKYNLTFQGIPAPKATTAEDYTKVLREFFVEELGIDEDYVEGILITNAHPIRYSDTAHKVPPIIAKFALMEHRDTVLSQAFNLKGKTFKIVTDLPRKMKDRRYILAQEAYKLRTDHGYETRIRIKGLDVIGEYREKGDKNQPWTKM